MNTLELPNAELIKKFTITKPTHEVIEKNGVPIQTEGHSQWQDITPAMAARWLKNNFRNRPVSDETVTAYARDMLNGVWMPTHQGIAFNDRDELIDGQHRLRAIVKSGKTIRMLVTFGLASKIAGSDMTTMDCVDRGRTRSVADQLKIQHGLADGTQITQVATALAGLCSERIRRPSVDQILKIYAEFKAPIDFVIANRSKQPGLKSAGVLAGFAFVMINKDGSQSPPPKLPMQAFAALNSDEGLEKFPVVKQLQAALTGSDAAVMIHNLNRAVAELTVQALFLEGCCRNEKLEFSLDGVNHFRAAHAERAVRVAALFKLPDANKIPAGEPAGKLGAAVPTQSPEPSPRTIIETPAAMPVKDRPSIDKIFAKVEGHFKISKFIITGRGRDGEIDSARIVFIHLARAAGHTATVTAAALKRTEEQIRDLTLPLAAMSTAQKKAVEQIKAKL